MFKWLNPFSLKYGPDLLAVIRLQYSYLLKTFHKYFSVFLPGPGNRLANTRLAASLRFSQPYEVVHKTWRLLFQPCPIDSRRARNERRAQSRLETAMLFPAPFALPIFLLPSFLPSLRLRILSKVQIPSPPPPSLKSSSVHMTFLLRLLQLCPSLLACQ